LIVEYFSNVTHVANLSVDLEHAHRSTVGKEPREYAMYVTFNSYGYQSIALFKTVRQVSPVAHLRVC
jgi:hypothetical protein